jgi:hypothetical protein
MSEEKYTITEVMQAVLATGQTDGAAILVKRELEKLAKKKSNKKD